MAQAAPATRVRTRTRVPLNKPCVASASASAAFSTAPATRGASAWTRSLRDCSQRSTTDTVSVFGGGGEHAKRLPMFGGGSATTSDNNEHTKHAAFDTSHGVCIADPDIMAQVLRFAHGVPCGDTWRKMQLDTLRFSAEAMDATTLLVATRPPHRTAVRIDKQHTAPQCTLAFRVDDAGTGVCAAVYTAAQTAFDAVRRACVGVQTGWGASPPLRQLPTAFTARGCPPHMFDTTALWPLPLLPADAGTAPDRCEPNDDGAHDMLAWFAWETLRRQLEALPPRRWQHTLRYNAAAAAGGAHPVIHTLLAELHATLEHTPEQGFQERVWDVLQTLEAVPTALRHAVCGAQGRWALTHALLAFQVLPTEPQLATCAGALRLLWCLDQAPTAAWRMSTKPSQLVHMSNWVLATHDFITGATDTPPLGAAVAGLRSTLDAAPLEQLAFAGAFATRLITERGVPPALAARVARRLCGSDDAVLAADDAAALRYFANTPTATPRLLWVHRTNGVL